MYPLASRLHERAHTLKIILSENVVQLTRADSWWRQLIVKAAAVSRSDFRTYFLAFYCVKTPAADGGKYCPSVLLEISSSAHRRDALCKSTLTCQSPPGSSLSLAASEPVRHLCCHTLGRPIKSSTLCFAYNPSSSSSSRNCFSSCFDRPLKLSSADRRPAYVASQERPAFAEWPGHMWPPQSAKILPPKIGPALPTLKSNKTPPPAVRP